MSDALSQVLAAAGKPTENVALPDGTRLALLPYGARVLGLFAPSDEGNFFWTNNALQNAEAAKAYFAGDGWHNTGGDRTWIAPELDTFYRDATFTQYWQPRELDMSDYRVDRVGGGCQLSRQMTLHLARTGADVWLELTKWFGPATHPLRCQRELSDVAARLDYAGYTQRVALRSLDAEPPAVGIWNLVQLPPGGEMLVPLYAPSAPQKCFGDVPSDSLVVDDRLLRVKVNFSGSHKIAIKAAALCGRAGYVYGDRDRWSLVIRNFFVNPSGRYVDVQRPDLEDEGYCFQMCRVDEPDFGSFCELEYHAPALGAPPDPRLGEDVSQVWAFRGPREAIDTTARALLGARP
ncbi:MAG: hypothetical protein JW809_00120 [Pirellulales bacterium]|nr:hypothetical protein [Pirellulales bacterium]